jgi:hypothetical protein
LFIYERKNHGFTCVNVIALGRSCVFGRFQYIDSYIDGRIYVVDFPRRRLRNYKKYDHLERF